MKTVSFYSRIPGYITILVCITSLTSLVSCRQESEVPTTSASPLFQRVSADDSGIHFTNRVQNSRELNIFSYRNFYNGGGVAIGDLNNDGLADIYFTHNTEPNALYINQGDFRFEDITEQAGVGGKNLWSTGVVLVDINADGWLDIYVCNAGYRDGDDQENELFVNNRDLTFTERAEEYGLNENGYTTHAAFFDYDLDGDLDCYVLNNSFIPVNTLNYSGKRELNARDWPVRDFLKGGGDKLLRNDNGRFTDVTEQAGIYSSLIGFGLGVTVGDVNHDRLPDMYISNDFFERDYLYINNGDGTFSEQIKDQIQHLSLSSMGADMADINNDGYPEIFVTDMLPDDEYRLKTTSSFESYAVHELKLSRDFYNQYMQNTLQLNNRNGTFSEIAYFSGVAASDWSWGALMFDMDNDGYRDIYVCNGIYQDVTDQDFIDFFANEIIQKMVTTGRKEELDSVLKHMPSNPILNKAFRNMGRLRFEENGDAWGFTEPSFSNGAAFGDLDNDGDLDLIVNNLNHECFVYKNGASQVSDQHYLKVRLKGTAQNTFAIGSSVSGYAGREVHFSEVIPSRGFQSSVEYTVHFGMGKTTSLDSLVVVWPDRTTSRMYNIGVDTLLELHYDEMARTPFEAKPAVASHDAFMAKTVHEFATPEEDHFIDFYREGLVAKMYSREGPAMSTGDVDGDGDTDIFIGGPAGHAARLYLQQEGKFVMQETTGLEREQDFEDVRSAFFDADGDGDMDLFVGSGGNTADPGSRELQDRVYLNDGKGLFALSPSALPNNGFNTGAVLPIDYDADGDIDLIVGSRSIPFNYGISPPSYVYQNNGKGKFENVTEKIAPDLARLGMITDLAMADVDGREGDEIIITGEWMAPVVFTYRNGKFNKTECGLDAYPGWWNVVEVADVDNDDDMDLILGNRGENFYYKGYPDAPAKLWLADFDDNGTVENIITRTVNGRDMPLALKREMTEQLAILKKKNLRHSEYATKSIQELFSPEVLGKAQLKTAMWFSSSIAVNNGKGTFTLTALPEEVQLSCVCGISCRDVNGDGATDLILGGNDYGFAPQFSRLDASFGQVLINNGDGHFSTVSSEESGFFIKGQVRGVQQMMVNGTPHLLVGLNAQAPVLYKFKEQ